MTLLLGLTTAVVVLLTYFVCFLYDVIHMHDHDVDVDVACLASVNEMSRLVVYL